VDTGKNYQNHSNKKSKPHKSVYFTRVSFYPAGPVLFFDIEKLKDQENPGGKPNVIRISIIEKIEAYKLNDTANQNQPAP
jgi:hypothetical protein